MRGSVLVADMLPKVARGAAFGAAIGGALSAATYLIKAKTEENVNLGVDVVCLKSNPKMIELLSRFRAGASETQRGQQLYILMVKSCDDVLALSVSKAGAGQFKAHRASANAVAAARALTKVVLKSNDLRAGPASDDADELEGMLNNILHNMILDG